MKDFEYNGYTISIVDWENVIVSKEIDGILYRCELTLFKVDASSIIARHLLEKPNPYSMWLQPLKHFAFNNESYGEVEQKIVHAIYEYASQQIQDKAGK